jgi:hypothetical protein
MVYDNTGFIKDQENEIDSDETMHPTTKERSKQSLNSFHEWSCGICPVPGCGRQMRRTTDEQGNPACICTLHPENGTYPPA